MRGEDYEQQEECRESWLISTRGVIVLFLYGFHMLKDRNVRDRAYGLLVAFLCIFVDGDFTTQLKSLVNPDPAALQLCPAVDGSCCHHMKDELSKLAVVERNTTTPPQVKLAALFKDAVHHACPSVFPFSTIVLNDVCDRVEQVAPIRAKTSDPSKAVSSTGRRLDSDVRHALGTQMILDGTAKNSAWAVRAVLGKQAGDSGTVRKIDDIESLAYQASCKRTHAAAWGFCVAIDGKRLGQPAEEVEVGLIWGFPAKEACWATPMAIKRGTIFCGWGRGVRILSGNGDGQMGGPG